MENETSKDMIWRFEEFDRRKYEVKKHFFKESDEDKNGRSQLSPRKGQTTYCDLDLSFVYNLPFKH